MITQKIIIVGNGCILTGKDLGKVIDGFDIVIRFNNFELNEENQIDFGTKTDIWIMNGRHYNECILKKYKYITNKDYKRNIKRKIVIGKPNKIKTNFEFWENKESKYHETFKFDEKYISSGLLAILMFLETNETIHVVNCDFFTNRKKYKYFTNKLRTTLNHHNWGLEKQIFQSLINDKRVLEIIT